MKTIIGMVADHREAEVLMRELRRLGFSKEDIEIIGMDMNGTQGENALGGSSRSIEEFFGPEEAPEVRGYYSQGVSPGGMIVSVFVEDEGAHRAAAAMSRHGALRIYSHSTEMTMVEEPTMPGKKSPSGGAGA